MSKKINEAIIITGGTRGIGRALSLCLVERGYRVAILYKSSDQAARELEQEAGGNGALLKAYKASVDDYQGVKRCFEKIRSELGPIYALINNAGITRDGYLMMMKEEDWLDVMNTNLLGVMNCTHLVLPYMKEQKRGIIVNISSTAGILGTSGQTNYSAAKSALIGFTRGLAVETVKDNIFVYGIAPGYIKTEMLDTIPKRTLEQVLGSVPMKRAGDTDEVGQAVLSLLEDNFSYSPGHTFIIDGGLSFA